MHFGIRKEFKKVTFMVRSNFSQANSFGCQYCVFHISLKTKHRTEPRPHWQLIHGKSTKNGRLFDRFIYFPFHFVLLHFVSVIWASNVEFTGFALIAKSIGMIALLSLPC
jgi:hypothetical protein